MFRFRAARSAEASGVSCRVQEKPSWQSYALSILCFPELGVQFLQPFSGLRSAPSNRSFTGNNSDDDDCDDGDVLITIVIVIFIIVIMIMMFMKISRKALSPSSDILSLLHEDLVRRTPI